MTRASSLSPVGEFPPTIPPFSKRPISAKAATTAATPAPIAIRFVGNGNFAPLFVASATASPDFAAVLAIEAEVSAAVAAALAVDAAALAACATALLSVAIVKAFTISTIFEKPSIIEKKAFTTPEITCQAFALPSRIEESVVIPSAIPSTPDHPLRISSNVLTDSRRQSLYVLISPSTDLRCSSVSGFCVSASIVFSSRIFSVSASTPIARILIFISRSGKSCICPTSACILGKSIFRCKAARFFSSAFITRCVFDISSSVCRVCTS